MLSALLSLGRLTDIEDLLICKVFVSVIPVMIEKMNSYRLYDQLRTESLICVVVISGQVHVFGLFEHESLDSACQKRKNVFL